MAYRVTGEEGLAQSDAESLKALPERFDHKRLLDIVALGIQCFDGFAGNLRAMGIEFVANESWVEAAASLELQGQGIDFVYLSVSKLESKDGTVYEVEVNYQVNFDAFSVQESVAELAFGLGLTIQKKKSFPEFGKVVAHNINASDRRFADLAVQMGGDPLLSGHLMATSSLWGSIQVFALSPKNRQGVLAFAIRGHHSSDPTLHPRELFNCYNAVAGHLKQCVA